MILTCSCKHSFQDKEYGKFQRVHNYAPGANSKTGGWRCTVCGAIKPLKTVLITPETVDER